MSSLSLYFTATNIVADFLKNNEERVKNHGRFYPIENYVVTPLSDGIVAIIKPFLINVWEATGKHFITDPITADRLKQMASAKKAYLLPLAKQTPSNHYLLNYPHQCAIVVARIFYISLRDIERAFTVSSKLQVASDKIITMVEQYAAKPAVEGILESAEEFKGQEGVQKTLKTSVVKWVANANNAAVAKAISLLRTYTKTLIESQEEKLRSKIISKGTTLAGNMALDAVSKLIVRTTLIAGGYSILKYGAHQVGGPNACWFMDTAVSVASVAGGAAGIYYWRQCLKSPLDKVYHSYHKDFREDVSVFREIGYLTEKESVKKLIHFASKKLNPIYDIELKENVKITIKRKVVLATSLWGRFTGWIVSIFAWLKNQLLLLKSLVL